MGCWKDCSLKMHSSSSNPFSWYAILKKLSCIKAEKGKQQAKTSGHLFYAILRPRENKTNDLTDVSDFYS